MITGQKVHVDFKANGLLLREVCIRVCVCVGKCGKRMGKEQFGRIGGDGTRVMERHHHRVKAKKMRSWAVDSRVVDFVARMIG